MSLREAVTRDAVFIAAVLRTLKMTSEVSPEAKLTAATWLERHASRQPGAPAVFHHDRVVSYRELDEGANRYARWASAIGLKKGEVCALLMENCPEFLMAWLGLAKNGIATALINTN